MNIKALCKEYFKEVSTLSSLNQLSRSSSEDNTKNLLDSVEDLECLNGAYSIDLSQLRQNTQIQKRIESGCSSKDKDKFLNVMKLFHNTAAKQYENDETFQLCYTYCTSNVCWYSSQQHAICDC